MIRAEATLRLSSRFLGFRRDVTEEQAINAAFDFVDQNGLTYVSHSFDGDRTVIVRYKTDDRARVQLAALPGLIVAGIVILAGGTLLTWNVLEIKELAENPVIQVLVGMTILVVGLGIFNSILGKRKS